MLRMSSLSAASIFKLDSLTHDICHSSTALSRRRQSNISIFFMHFLISLYLYLLGDSKWLWITVAIVYEDLCGNCVGGRVDISMTFHKRAFDFFIPLHIGLTIFKTARLCTVKEVSTLSYPQSCHIFKFSYIVAILIHNSLESPNILLEL
jgi:hypothetical protein